MTKAEATKIKGLSEVVAKSRLDAHLATQAAAEAKNNFESYLQLLAERDDPAAAASMPGAFEPAAPTPITFKQSAG